MRHLRALKLHCSLVESSKKDTSTSANPQYFLFKEVLLISDIMTIGSEMQILS